MPRSPVVAECFKGCVFAGNIDQHQITEFIQQNANSGVLNRVTGVDPSSILGSLVSNGKVYLVNPKGGSIAGRPAYRSVAELPEPADLAVIENVAGEVEVTVNVGDPPPAKVFYRIAAGQ